MDGSKKAYQPIKKFMVNFNRYFPYKKEGIIYFDNATNTQLPLSVINNLIFEIKSLQVYPKKNIYIYHLKKKKEIEDIKFKVAEFLGVEKEELFFVNGATSGLQFLIKLINKKKKILMFFIQETITNQLLIKSMS